MHTCPARVTAIVLGIIAVLIGVVWIGQGLNLLPGKLRVRQQDVVLHRLGRRCGRPGRADPRPAPSSPPPLSRPTTAGPRSTRPALAGVAGTPEPLVAGPVRKLLEGPAVAVREASAKYTEGVPTAARPPRLTETPRVGGSSRAAAASATTICIESSEPGAIVVRPLPMAMEQAEPGGVSCTKRMSSLTVWSTSTTKPTWSA